VLYWVLKFTIGTAVKVVFRPLVTGRKHIPDSGPALLVGNHPSFSDTALLSAVLRRRVAYVAKLEYFTGTGLKGWFRRFIVGGMGNIPVDRTGGRKGHVDPHDGAGPARQGATRLHLRGGHPPAGQPALPGQGRCGAHRPGDRRARRPGGDAEYVRDPAAGNPAAEHAGRAAGSHQDPAQAIR